jgi:transcriptional regulator GlxA family with amidase domain
MYHFCAEHAFNRASAQARIPYSPSIVSHLSAVDGIVSRRGDIKTSDLAFPYFNITPNLFPLTSLSHSPFLKPIQTPTKMSITKPLRVLIPMHDKLDALDFMGPYELLSHARLPNPASPSDLSPTIPSILASPHAFEIVSTSLTQLTVSNQGATFSRTISMEEAHVTLSTFDILIIPGGSAPPVLESKAEPLHLIKAFAALPAREEGNERIIMSVCTGALFLASQGVLKGLTATTHFASLDRLRGLTGGGGEVETNVIGENGERFVVNPVGGEGGKSLKGYRVITSAGVSAGMDLGLWLIEHLLGEGMRKHVERWVEYQGRLSEGLVLG